jgi:AbrB family looped-hinge helix DNA binding protein
MKTVVSSKGQIVLPAAVRRLDDVRAGHLFEVERVDRGEYRLRRIESAPNEGLVDWLLACPVKGFLSDDETGETTDSILPEIR